MYVDENILLKKFLEFLFFNRRKPPFFLEVLIVKPILCMHRPFSLLSQLPLPGSYEWSSSQYKANGNSEIYLEPEHHSQKEGSFQIKAAAKH